MNADAHIAERFAREDEAPPARRRIGFLARLRAEPLLPEAGSGGAPLTAVIAVMSFLATLSLAAFLFIAQAAGEWTSELRSGVTVQIKGADADSIAEQTRAALAVLQGTDGVIEARALSQEESARLLEPWLGRGNVGAYLNVPALIEARIDETLRRDMSALESRLLEAAPAAVIDDHGEWHGRLAAAAQSGQALAFAVFLLVMAAACAISVFAARAGLAANREVVSLLHLVGATDGFIAGQVHRRFLALGMRGAAAGAALAVGALTLAGLALDDGTSDFLPGLTAGFGAIAPLLIVPVALCLATAYSARYAVLRTLAREL